MTAAIATLLAGLAIGWAAARLTAGPRSPTHPPATARQLANAARANRADLSQVRRRDNEPVPPAIDHFEGR